MTRGEQIGLANYMKLAFLLLLLPLAGFAKEPYSTRALSEKEIVQMYQRVLLEGCQHAHQFWQERRRRRDGTSVPCWMPLARRASEGVKKLVFEKIFIRFSRKFT
jgi:hypothetical protein